MPNTTSSLMPSDAIDEQWSAGLDKVIEQALSEQRLVGAVVKINRHGKNVYRRAAGFSDREAGQAMRENALFRFASVSKLIVATAAMALVAQGRLALDEDIRQWLPYFQPRLADGAIPAITPRQLLSHTAGLGYRFLESDSEGPYALAGVSDGMDAAGITLEENLRRLASVPLLYAPGCFWGYSLAIDVLGAVIEQASGLTLDKAVRKLVTAPLNMNDTAFYTRDSERLATAYVNDIPRPHRLQEGERVSSFEGTIGTNFSPARALDQQTFPSGGAGMVGSADDLLILLETLRSGGAPLLPATLVEEMGSDQIQGLMLPDAPGLGFGLGFSVLRDPQAANSPESVGTWRWGGVYGHSWFVDRAQGFSVVALTNTLYEGMSGRFVSDLRDAVYGINTPEGWV